MNINCSLSVCAARDKGTVLLSHDYESEVLEWYRGYSTIVGLITGKTF